MSALDYVAAWRESTRPAPVWPEVVRVDQVATSDGFVRHAVLFEREVTVEAFVEYVRSVNHFGYDPRAYSGYPSVHGCVGVWTRYSSCG